MVAIIRQFKRTGGEAQGLRMSGIWTELEFTL